MPKMIAEGVPSSGTIIVQNIEVTTITQANIGTPPEGYKQVTNIYVDPATGKLTVEYEAD